MKHLTLIIVLCLSAVSCGGGKKQTLLTEEEKTQQHLDTLYNVEQVMDTIIPKPGIKEKESRAADPQNPPVTIDLSAESKEGTLDLADYYKQVRYLKVKHPMSENGIAFLGDANFVVEYDQGMSSGGGINSSVSLSGHNIIAGDPFFGYHCFDSTGVYAYTIVAKEDQPTYDKQKNEIYIKMKPTTEFIRNMSVMGDNCLTGKSKERKAYFEFHNFNTRKTYLRRPASNGSSFLLSPDTYVGYYYGSINSERTPIMFSFDIKGDTLCKFMNYNPLVKPRKSASTNPESDDFYYLNGVLTMRQAYNDTIYRVVSPSHLLPVYVLNAGSRKATPEIARYGNKADRLFVNKILETNNFMLVIYTINYDCPNNRNNNTVNFHYTLYDKKKRKQCALPSGGKFPEEFTLQNSIEGGLPLLVTNTKIGDGILYTSFTKGQLKSILDGKNFSSMPQPTREKVKELYDGLSDYELLIMVLS